VQTLPPSPPLLTDFVNSLLIGNQPPWHLSLAILTPRTRFLLHSRTGATLARATVKQNREFGDPCGENCATTTKIKNRRWQNFSLHQFMSKRVFKKDPGLPSQIWDRYYPPSTLGTTLLCSAAGGEARTGCRPSSLLKQKNR
jgi:hypothetical protein